jgi:hypothetical protein
VLGHKDARSTQVYEGAVGLIGGMGALAGRASRKASRRDGLGDGLGLAVDAACDTTTDVGKLLITIMGGIAQFERGLIQARCDAGIERARKQGKKFGRPERPDAGQKRVIAERYSKGATIPELARNTASASAPSGGAFNPKPRQRRRRRPSST